jgi:hypothetical protein
VFGALQVPLNSGGLYLALGAVLCILFGVGAADAYFRAQDGANRLGHGIDCDEGVGPSAILGTLQVIWRREALDLLPVAVVFHHEHRTKRGDVARLYEISRSASTRTRIFLE